jgi:nucleotide-binding universal stress UspA family protein
VTALYAHIACCVDDTPAARAALAEARSLRALTPGRLSLVHAGPRPLMEQRGEEGWEVDPRDRSVTERVWIETLAASVPGAEAVYLTGNPPAVVCDWAAEEAVDLLVAASSKGVLERVILGSFAAHVATHAPCSVLLVRPPRPAPEP